MNCVHAFHGCYCFSKKYRIHWGMDGHNYFCEIRTMFSEENCSLPLNTGTCEKNCFFLRNNFFGSQRFGSQIFVHMSVIAIVFCFSVYKLIGWDQGNIFLFKVIIRNIWKRYEIFLKLTINTIEIRSSVFVVNFKCISQFFLVFLLLTLNR